jgi:ketosteroid isomerase-like protein
MKRYPYRAAFAGIVITLLVACSGPTSGPEAKPADAAVAAKTTLDSAMQADRDFAAAVKKDGPKTAFLAWFEMEGSQFIDRGSMLTGATAIAAPFEQSPPGFMLDWTPDGGHASAAGDFATTTGRYTVKMGDQQIDAGRYVTTWKKNAEGDWKVVLDATIADPTPAGAVPIPPDPDGRPG